MNTKSEQQEPEEKEKETDELNFVIAAVSNIRPVGLSDPLARGKSIANLVDALQAADPKSSDAKANKTSISDNNGGRIELEEDLDGPDVIKK